MDQAIKPMLQSSLASVVKEVQSNLEFVSGEFSNRLVDEEERNKNLIEKLSEKIETLQGEINDSPSGFSHMPPQNPYYMPHHPHPYYPPPYGHPYYPTPPHYGGYYPPPPLPPQ